LTAAIAVTAGPLVGVKAVTITDATQLVAPPRWSDTVTTPRGPLIVLALLETACDPMDTLPVGALIDSAPAVSVNDAVVSAQAGRAAATARAAKALAKNKHFRIMFIKFHFLRSRRPEERHHSSSRRGSSTTVIPRCEAMRMDHRATVFD
jgi:hypothetical protein